MEADHANTKLLLVDDDPEILELLEQYLTKQGFEVFSVPDGTAMDAVLEESEVDLIVLDLMLPGEDGLSIARRLKKASDTPIIILSAQGEDVDRIVGLEIGADDYLGKPFNPRELLARVRAVLRRAQGGEVRPNVIEFGRFRMDLNAHQLTRENKVVNLTSGEFDLLKVLAMHPNQVLHRDKILELLTGEERSRFDRSIDVRITRLRGKIEEDPSAPLYIKTIWAKGYMFCPDVA